MSGDLWPAIERGMARHLDNLAAEATEHALGNAPQIGDYPTSVRKLSYALPVSLETMLWAGLITEDEARAQGWTPPPPPSRLERLRRRWRDWRYTHTPRVHLGPCDHEGCE